MKENWVDKSVAEIKITEENEIYPMQTGQFILLLTVCTYMWRIISWYH